MYELINELNLYYILEDDCPEELKNNNEILDEYIFQIYTVEPINYIQNTIVNINIYENGVCFFNIGGYRYYAALKVDCDFIENIYYGREIWD